MKPQCKLIKKYQNGNYTVFLYADGTKIRYSNDDEFKPSFPESIDLKITNQCDLLCPMCHEKSTKDGRHATLEHPFLTTLKSGTELAIGGGNPLSHPNLIFFLNQMKEQGVIANLTINQYHLINNIDLVKELINNKLIYGLGVSITNNLYINEITDFANDYQNTVIHIIAGVTPYNIIESLFNKNIKLLILGYKKIGRGKSYYSDSIKRNIKTLENNLLNIKTNFKLIAFDNLAIQQLNLNKKIENFDTLYMGDDGEYTMYIDLVKKEYAASSTSFKRYLLEDDIEKMFTNLKTKNTI